MAEGLRFTNHVLGLKATRRLAAHRVTQTLRSAASSYVLAAREGRLKPGDKIIIFLDGVPIGYAIYLNMDRLQGYELRPDDALRGGFDNLVELGAALKRAGYRFKAINEYFFWRIMFKWPEIEKQEGK